MNIQEKIAQELYNLIVDSYMVGGSLVDQSFQRDHQIWILTKDSQVLRITVETETAFEPDDFGIESLKVTGTK